MTYIKGDCTISVERIEGMGKRKGLFVGTQNEYCSQLTKVASFSSDDMADIFCKWLEYFLFDKKIEVESDEKN